MPYPIGLSLLTICSLILLAVNLPRVSTSPLDDSIASHGPSRAIAPGKLGAVASESSICSRYGVEMLEMGGNAADAVSLLDYDPFIYMPF